MYVCTSYYLTANLTIAKRGNVKMKVLVINAGSSSLKYQLIDMEGEKLLAKGLCERIGIDGHLKHTPMAGDKPVFNEDVPLPTHSEAIAAVLDKLTSEEYGVVKSMHEIDAVGHRVVHGGEKFACSVLITGEVMKALEECTPFAPPAQPGQYHRHQRLRGGHGQGCAPGRRV